MLLREAGRYRGYNCSNLSQGILSFYFDLAVWQVSWTKFFTFLSLDCLLIRHQKCLLGSVANANEIILIKDLPPNQIYSKCACVFVYCCYFLLLLYIINIIGKNLCKVVCPLYWFLILYAYLWTQLCEPKFFLGK